MAGFSLRDEISRASGPIRPLLERLGEASEKNRESIWNEHIADLSDEEADALVQAVAEVNPRDPAPEDDGWSVPELESPVGVEPFPVDVFPAPVARLVCEGSKAIGCAPDFLGMTVLAVAGAAIGRSTSLRLKDNYFASAAFYVVNVGKPGDGKSPAMSMVVRPLWKIDEEEHKRFKGEMAEYELGLIAYDDARKRSRSRPITGKPRRNRQQDGDLDGDNDLEGLEDLPEPIPPTRPVLHRIVVDDATTESLALILADNPRGLLVAKDELTALMASLNQYKSGKGTDRQFYLSAWSGSPVVVDRKGSASREPVRVQHPHLGIVGGMPPDMLGDLAEARGRDDGFIDRLLFAYPDPLPKTGWCEEGVSKETSEAWDEIIEALWDHPLALIDRVEIPQVIDFTPSAKVAWRAWYDSHHTEQNADDFPDWLRGPWAKMEQYAGRVVHLLHRLRWAAAPSRSGPFVPDIDPQTVRDATRFIGYLKSHLRRVHATMRVKSKGNDGGEFSQKILRWVQRDCRESFSERDLIRNFPRFGGQTKELQAALNWLEARKCIRRQEQTKPPGRRGRLPSPAFDVNPRLIPALEGRESPFPSSGPGHEPIFVNSVNIAAEKEESDAHLSL